MAHRGAGFVALMFEDVGRDSLATRPSAEGWLASARLLARMRHHAQGRLTPDGGLPPGSGLTFGTAEIVDVRARAAAALAAMRPDLAGALDRCEPLLGPNLRRLADWQLAFGGVVWTLRALRWVLEEGCHVVPGAAGWVDELVERAGACADRLAHAGR